MPLADVSRLLDLEPAEWRSVADRLRALGVDARAIHPYAGIGLRASDPLQQAMRWYHLRKVRSPLGYALRLLVFRDAVGRREAEEVLGSAKVLDRLIEVGFLRHEPDGNVRCPFFVNLVNQLYVACDDLTTGDGVMGLGHTTGDLVRASAPTRDIGSVLEVGCGAGTALLVCAARARRGVGVDIDPRAITIARANARLNGIENLELRQGDLFEPVRGEKFDLVVAQPPFVCQPPEDAAITWMHGGSRGDELPLRLLSGVAAHLAPGGRAVVLVEWPVLEGDAEPLEARVRRAVGDDDVDVLLLSSVGTDLDDHCIGYASGRPPFVGPEVERAAVARRAHLDRLGVRDLRLTLNVIQRRAAGARARPPWTSRVDTRAFSEVSASGPQIDRLVLGRDLLALDAETLCAARLGLPDGTRLHEEEDGRIRVQLPDRALVPPLHLNPHAARLVTIVDQSPDVRTAVETLAPAAEGDMSRRILEAVREALRTGVLEVRSGSF